jgi:hypothetical protein
MMLRANERKKYLTIEESHAPAEKRFAVALFLGLRTVPVGVGTAL